MDNKDKLIQICYCPVCKQKVKLEYLKTFSHNMTSYNIKIVSGCPHFQEGEYLNEQYCRLLNSLLQNRQATYDELVNARAKRKLQELGLNKEDIRRLY